MNNIKKIFNNIDKKNLIVDKCKYISNYISKKIMDKQKDMFNVKKIKRKS